MKKIIKHITLTSGNIFQKAYSLFLRAAYFEIPVSEKSICLNNYLHNAGNLGIISPHFTRVNSQIISKFSRFDRYKILSAGFPYSQKI